MSLYPDEMREIFSDAWPDFPADDFKRIGEKIDFLGINYYTRGVVRDDPLALPVRTAYVRQPEHGGAGRFIPRRSRAR